MALLTSVVTVSLSQDFDKGLELAKNGYWAVASLEFTPLAEQGHAEAQFMLGGMYNDGLGVAQDHRTAVKWFSLAAEQGHPDAQNNLGTMYVRGTGVLQDHARAHMWFNIAASNGIEGAARNRDTVSRKMTPADISKAQLMAQECVEKNYMGC